MNPWKKYKLKRNQNFFDLTPERTFESTKDINGIVTIHIPRFDNNAIGRFLSSKSTKEDIKAELDETGSIVWEAIDGKNTVFDITKILRKRMDSIEQADERTVEYMKKLYDNSFINFKEL
jgi:adenylate kinase family enzyme